MVFSSLEKEPEVVQTVSGVAAVCIQPPKCMVASEAQAWIRDHDECERRQGRLIRKCGQDGCVLYLL